MYSIKSLTEAEMRPNLFLAISILLLTLWITGYVMFNVANVLFHLLLLLAILFLVGHLVADTTTT
jgi:hypothetical protein